MRLGLLSIVGIIMMTICIVITEGYSLFGTTLSSRKIETTRRIFWIHIVTTTSVSILPSLAVTQENPISTLLSNVQESRKQLDTIPKYMDASQWDSVRAQLIRPPLSDCWVKTSRPWLTNYVEAIGTTGGDELAALEAREELQSHLRYLDMAVYNNNFNPIVSIGTNGASQDLIRSYFEDPIREWKASVKALDELLALGQGLQNNS